MCVTSGLRFMWSATVLRGYPVSRATSVMPRPSLASWAICFLADSGTRTILSALTDAPPDRIILGAHRSIIARMSATGLPPSMSQPKEWRWCGARGIWVGGGFGGRSIGKPAHPVDGQRTARTCGAFFGVFLRAEDGVSLGLDSFDAYHLISTPRNGRPCCCLNQSRMSAHVGKPSAWAKLK